MRNILFNVFLILWSLIYLTISLPALLLPPQLSICTLRPWSYVVLKALQFICGVKYEVRGTHNVNIKRKAIFMSKHHSALDAILICHLIKAPLCVIKRELLFIPLVGIYLMAYKMITIDRKSYSLSLKTMLKKIKEEIIAGKRNIIIFPEGQRVGLNEEIKYQRGIGVIYNQNKHKDIDFIPVAVNCGIFWPHSILGNKTSGTTILEFLPPVDKSLSTDQFMETLQHSINQKSNELIDEHYLTSKSQTTNFMRYNQENRQDTT